MLAMRKSFGGLLHEVLLWEAGLHPPHPFSLPVSPVEEWGQGGGIWACQEPTLGLCFSWFVPLPTASPLPGRAPAWPPFHPLVWHCQHNPIDL